ncbi:hypothetical protein D9V30_00145 [Mycetocola reblochoni]|uniref:Uncharacterized protein n=1 Tax=Mycetocola reblochoni TaxID=331618 RepID=A0A3L6ZUZ7_9MICO|nr:hypothetical protein [Mycetocola reblochoni]RLP70882.1 hypothetical protein D9V30_00145 [Mycetocola reblochoni]
MTDLDLDKLEAMADELNQIGAGTPEAAAPEVIGDAADAMRALIGRVRDAEANADKPTPCVMTHTPPFDFAQCETHDTTFPLGGACKWHGQTSIFEVLDREAMEQRGRAVRAEMQRDVLKARLDAQAPDEGQRKSLDRVIGAVVSNSMNHPVPHVVLGRDVSGLRMKLTDAVLAWLQGNGWAAPDESEWEYAKRVFNEEGDLRLRVVSEAEARANKPSGHYADGSPYWGYTIVRRRKAGEWEPVEPPS